MKVVKYNSSSNITVEFENGYTRNTTWQNFMIGSPTSPFDKTIHGVGYLGSLTNDGLPYSKCKIYTTWHGMMTRCYGSVKSKRDYVYDDCIVDNEWHNFQNFKEWYLKNYYQVNDEKMNLDKDILFKGNKVYSPNTCIFVPREINTLFIQSNRIRGKYPVGVYFKKDSNKFKAQCKRRNEVIHLGYFDTAEDGFYAYKEYKEKYIKEVADNYKNEIPNKLYEAMYNYQIEITD